MSSTPSLWSSPLLLELLTSFNKTFEATQVLTEAREKEDISSYRSKRGMSKLGKKLLIVEGKDVELKCQGRV